MGPNSWAPIAMLQDISIYYGFAKLALQKHPKRSRMATFGPIMPARPRFKLKIGSNLRPSKPNLRPNVPGNAHLEPTMSSNTHLPCHKVLMSMMPKPKQSLMWSRTRIAIELKGLAAPGEALKNYKSQGLHF